VRRLNSPEMESARIFGKRLFEAVFGSEVFGCLRSSLDRAEEKETGLRLRLRLNAPELADLPWEYLYNPALNRFLVLAVETPLVRYLELPERIRPLAVKPPLKILVMIASPNDHPALDVEQEWEKLNQALALLQRRGLVALHRLEEATLSRLQRHLRQDQYHIFHFIGHGAFDEQSRDGVLLLEDEMRRGRRVSGHDLGTLLHNHRPLRLAVLNACEGGRTSRTDPFTGTAQSLVQQGIPAVIAMQFEITDAAAITFAHEFYSALADGYPVDAAVVEARTAIFAAGNDVEWGTPVLYMRVPDGKIFDIERSNVTEYRPAPRPVAQSPRAEPALRPVQRPAPHPQASSEPKPKPAAAPPASSRKALALWRNPWILSLAFITMVLVALALFKNLTFQEPSSKESSTSKPVIKEQENPYTKYRDDGNAFLQQSRYAEAKRQFEMALQQKPGDQYAAEQIKLCDQKIAEQTGVDEREKLYAKYKSEGDTFFNQGRFESARLRYEDALNEKPGDVYATNRINECNEKIAGQENETKRERLYAQYRDAGDAYFGEGDYAKAKNQYEQARSYKSADRYVKERIQECNSRLLAAQKPKEETPAGMVRIPAGYFMMGSEDGGSEEKLHKVYVDAFYMDKYEVTVAQYQRFLDAKPQQRQPENWQEQLQYPKRPVVYVTWEDAKAYADWLDKKLPTEAQWEYAARGGFTGVYGKPHYKYPWGNDYSSTKANFSSSPEDVGSYSPNGYGLYDMAGNVWEWCADWYDENYYGASPSQNPRGPSSGTLRVLRGGSWDYLADDVRCAGRGGFDPAEGYSYVGFRCVQDVR